MRILIGYDGSSHADTAIDDLQWAGLPDKAEATVLSAVELPTMNGVRSWGMIETDFSPKWLDCVDQADRLSGNGALRVQKYFCDWSVDLETSLAHPPDAILEKADAWLPELIVVGTHGRSAVGRALLGSVSLEVVRRAHCSVRVARSRNHGGPLRLLIGVDGSPQANAAVDEVCSRCWPAGTEARIVAVHEVLVPVSEERIAIGEKLFDQINEGEHLRLRYCGETAAEKLIHAGLATTFTLQQGDTKHVLVNEARNWNADTIFLGARGLGQVESFVLGSVSSSAVARAPCTVEVVRHRSRS